MKMQAYRMPDKGQPIQAEEGDPELRFEDRHVAGAGAVREHPQSKVREH